MKQLIKDFPIKDLIPFDRNPRKNEKAVDAVIKSIQSTGNNDPIEVNEQNVILAGHTRALALKKMGIEATDVLRISGLTEQQQKDYRVLSNKTSEIAEWDMAMLQEDFTLDELAELGFVLGEDEFEKYSQTVKSPIYEPKNNAPDLSSLINEYKFQELVSEIEASQIDGVIKQFLIKAAYRHMVFDYALIADYYSHADAETQNLMEKSGLVIIDFNKAIENGFIELTEEIAKNYSTEYPK